MLSVFIPIVLYYNIFWKSAHEIMFIIKKIHANSLFNNLVCYKYCDGLLRIQLTVVNKMFDSSCTYEIQ